MDFNGNCYTEQSNLAEKSSLNTMRTLRKNQEENKNESHAMNLENHCNLSPDILQNFEIGNTNNLGIRHSEGDDGCFESYSDRAVQRIDRQRSGHKSNWEYKDCEILRDNFSYGKSNDDTRLFDVSFKNKKGERTSMEFRVECNNDLYRDTKKSGITVSVVSLHKNKNGNKIVVKPKYNVSITRCGRVRRKCGSKPRRRTTYGKLVPPVHGTFFTSNYNKIKRFMEKEKRNRENSEEQYESTDKCLRMNCTNTFGKSEKDNKCSFNKRKKLKNEEKFPSIEGNKMVDRNREIPSFFFERTSDHPRETSNQQGCNNCENCVPKNSYYKNSHNKTWNNTNSKTTCAQLEACCCLYERKTRSSNFSLRSTNSRRSCKKREENKRLDITPETKYSHFNYFLINRHIDDCLNYNKNNDDPKEFSFNQREDLNKSSHNSYPSYSRSYSPSKTSLLVETGRSVRDFHNSKTPSFVDNLRHHNTSVESVNNDLKRKKYAVSRNSSGSLESEGKSKLCKNSDLSMYHSRRRSKNYKTRSNRIRAISSDEFPDENRSTRKRQKTRKLDGRQLTNERSPILKHIDSATSTKFRTGHRFRTRTNSSALVCQKESKLKPRPETCEKCSWTGIEKGTFWSQLHGVCRNVIKLASNSLCQAIKGFSKSKHLDKVSKHSFENEKCTKTYRKEALYKKEKNHVCEECMRKAVHRETMLKEQTPYDCRKVRCCRDNYNVASRNASFYQMPQSQMGLNKNHHYGHYYEQRERTPSEKSWYFDPHEGGIQEDIYPQSSGRGPFKDLYYPNYPQTRKKGGSDGNPGSWRQKRKNSNSHPRTSLDTSEQLYNSNNGRNVNLKNQGRRIKSSMTQENNNSRRGVADDKNSILGEYQQTKSAASSDYQAESIRAYVDVCIQASTIRMDIQSTNVSLTDEGMENMEEIESARQMEIHPDAIADMPYNETRSLIPFSKQETRYQVTPTKQVTTSPKKRDSQHSTTLKSIPETHSKYVNPENNNGGEFSSGKRGDTVSEEKSAIQSAEKNDLNFRKDSLDSTADKSLQCQIIRKYQILCVNDNSKKILDQVEKSCLCSSPKIVDTPVKIPDKETKTTTLVEPDKRKEQSKGEVTFSTNTTIPAEHPTAIIPDQTIDVSANDSFLPESTTVEDITDDDSTVPNLPEGTIVLSEDETSDTPISEADTEKNETSGISTSKPESDETEEHPTAITVDVTLPVEEGIVVADSTTFKPITITTHDLIQESTLNTNELGDVPTSTPMRPQLPYEYYSNLNTTYTKTDESSQLSSTPVPVEEVNVRKDELSVEEPKLQSDTRKEPLALIPRTDQNGITKVDQPGEPIRYVQDLNGNRTYVTTEMQTSNTILTKILSEFDFGNKRKRILMSVKLQTTSDHDAPNEVEKVSTDREIQTAKLHVTSLLGQQWSTEYSSNTVTPESRMEINGLTEQYDDTEYLKLPENLKGKRLPIDDSITNGYKQTRKTSVNKSVPSKSRKAWNSVNNGICSRANCWRDESTNGTQKGERERQLSRENSTNTHNGVIQKKDLRKRNSCAGPCGKKKPPQHD